MCKSFSPSQIRPLNCGRWVRETRDQRDTTWKMRRDGSRTSLPSPLCRCLHTHAHAHTQYLTDKIKGVHMQACMCMYQVDIRLASPVCAFYGFAPALIWSLTPVCLSLLSPFSLPRSFCPFILSLLLSISVPKVPELKPTDLMVEVRPRRVFSNGHTYHINSISVNSDGETYLSADDLRINNWHLGITDRSFSILPNSDCFFCFFTHFIHISCLIPPCA